MERSLSGIRDVDLKILEELNDKDLLSFCLTNKYGKTLCENEDFWRQRFIKRFGNHEKLKERTWKNFYLNLLYYSDKYKKYRINEALRVASEKGMKNIDLIKYFISQGADNWNYGLLGASYAGDKNLVDFFISKGANWFVEALYEAAKGGHKDLVEFFISKGVNTWNTGLFYSSYGGHRELVDFFIEKGATNINNALYGAALGGHKDLVEFFISKGATNIKSAIRAASGKEHYELAKYLEKFKR